MDSRAPDAEVGREATGERDRGILRFLTCGSVDDGKSTLIGRLLFDSRLVCSDHLGALERDSRRYGTVGKELDLALLLDGLDAEREQGITIDVAYRFFNTQRRHFIVADTPGHDQYTHNMATGASTADLAVLVVDARNGIVAQTKRHSSICSLLGIRHIVLAVNKSDLVGYSEKVFARIVADYLSFAAALGFSSIVPIPLSARFGDNVVVRGRHMPWYVGPTLVEHLESVDVESELLAKPFRFPVQWVNRPHADFRGFSGTVASGRIRPGEAISVVTASKTARVERIVTADGDLDEAAAGDAVTLTLSTEIDIARGDLLASAEAPARVGEQFAALVICMADHALLPGRSYRMRIGTKWTQATITRVQHKIDNDTLGHMAARELTYNELGICELAVSTPIAFDPYVENRETGSFILVDRFNNETIAAGTIRSALGPGIAVHPETLAFDKTVRAGGKGHKPCILWFTGLSGAGKSTLAKALERRLHALGHDTYMLDGDILRHGLNRDLGFSNADRVENIRRAGEVAKLFVDAGLIVLCSFISPFHAERQMVREMVEADEFIEVFVDAPLEECVRRDPKGLYAKAKAGLIKNFTGFDSPYEVPENPDLHLRTVSASAEDLAERIVVHLQRTGRIN